MDFFERMADRFNYVLNLFLRIESLFGKNQKMSSASVENYNSMENNSVTAMIAEKPPMSKRSPHFVSEHVRNLPVGQRASSKQIEMALMNGVQLEAGETFVRRYTTH